MAVVLYVVLMSLFAMRMAPFQALLTALVPASERGAFLSLTIAVGQVGTALGAAVGGRALRAAGASRPTPSPRPRRWR